MSGIYVSEVYRIIPGFSAYWVSNLGALLSRRKRGPGEEFADVLTVLTPSTTKRGYKLVILVDDESERKNMFVHSAVLLAFEGPCPDGMQCRHLDGNPANNNLSNLIWGTGKENAEDRDRHGTTNRMPGEKHPLAQLTAEKVIEIKRRLLAGENHRLIGEDYGVTRTAISAINNGRTWSHVPWPNDERNT
jgi:hypothetical protein